MVMEENTNYYYQLIFKKLFSISLSILNEYNILTTLEKNNEKTKNYYQRHYETLLELLNQEDNFYDAIKSSPDILKALLKKIAYFNKNATDFITPQNENYLAYARISLKLSKFVTSQNKNKSVEIFALFNRFDLFSLIHLENILMALILMQKYLREHPNIILQDVLTTMTYTYSFMFPYIEESLIKRKFTIPNDLYSSSEFWQKEMGLTDEEVQGFKIRKFNQIKDYLRKNKVNNQDYLFLIFYLKALSQGLNDSFTKNIIDIIQKSGLNKTLRYEIKDFIDKENTIQLIRKITFLN